MGRWKATLKARSLSPNLEDEQIRVMGWHKNLNDLVISVNSYMDEVYPHVEVLQTLVKLATNEEFVSDDIAQHAITFTRTEIARLTADE